MSDRGLDSLLFLNNSIPTYPAVRPYIGPHGDSSMLVFFTQKRCRIDQRLSSYGSKLLLTALIRNARKCTLFARKSLVLE